MDLSLARKAIEKLYVDICTVIAYREIENPDTHITSMREVTLYQNVPCKLSHKTIATSGNGVAASLSLVSKLIIKPELVIKPGSKIYVARNGKTLIFKSSGEPAKFLNHQEIMLEQWEDYA